MSRQAVKGSIERSCSPCIDQGAPSKNDRPSIATACEHSDVERKTRSAGRNTSTICIEACLNRHMARTPLKVGVATRRDGPLLSHHPAAGACRAKSSPGRSHEHPCGQGFGPHGLTQFDDLSGAGVLRHIGADGPAGDVNTCRGVSIGAPQIHARKLRSTLRGNIIQCPSGARHFLTGVERPPLFEVRFGKMAE